MQAADNIEVNAKKLVDITVGVGMLPGGREYQEDRILFVKDFNSKLRVPQGDEATKRSFFAVFDGKLLSLKENYQIS
jgi:hypothetical protein